MIWLGGWARTVSTIDRAKIDSTIAEVFDTFRDVEKPSSLVSCDCGSCFSPSEANELFSQHPERMDLKLLGRCFEHYSVTQDNKGLRYLLPAFMKAVLEATSRGDSRFDFYIYRFGSFLQEIGIEAWPDTQQKVVWNWLEVELDLLLAAGRLNDYDAWVTSLIRPNFEWKRYASLLKEPRHKKAKLGHIAFFLPWENGYENAPDGFYLSYSDADDLSSKHKEAYYDWMIMNLSTASPLSKT